MKFCAWISALTLSWTASLVIAAPLNLALAPPNGTACPDNAAKLPTCDYVSPAFDINAFFLAQSGLIMSGTGFSFGPGPAPLVSGILLTAPAPVAAPAAFIPPGGAVPALYAGIRGASGVASIQASHVVTAPAGQVTLVTGITGFVYYPNANSGSYSITLENQAAGCADTLVVGGINPGPAGSVVPIPGLARTLANCASFGGGSVAHVVTLSFDLGDVVVFLPGSAEGSVGIGGTPPPLSDLLALTVPEPENAIVGVLFLAIAAIGYLKRLALSVNRNSEF